MKEKDCFGRDTYHKNGLSSYCIPCGRDVRRENNRLRRERNPGMKTKEYQLYCLLHPDAVWAQKTLNRAVRNGKIKRSTCEVCGEIKVHGHHDDYQYPLNVHWLCPVHHTELHTKASMYITS